VNTGIDNSPCFLRQSITANGQDNYQTLSGVAADIFCLLEVNCPVIAGHAVLTPGALALIHSPACRFEGRAALRRTI